MSRKIMALILIATYLGFSLTGTAYAQEEPAYIVSSTSPISSELRDYLDAWLAVSPPSDAVYYAVTYTQLDGDEGTFSSLVGLLLDVPEEEWSLTEEDGTTKVIWLGTVKVRPDGSVDLLTPTQSEMSRNRSAKLASLNFAPPPTPLMAGGGAYIRFPWEPAKAVKWGVNGLHGADYSLGGQWRAVDLVSGTDMGSGAANDRVYASNSGDVDWVCDDGTTVAITTDNASDPILYAHLLDNANLEIGHTFASGSVIGTLKHGSFVDSCGTAVQTAEHWHLHWGFVLGSNASFQAEGCILTLTGGVGVGGGAVAVGEKWTCGTTIVRPSNYLTHYGNIPLNADGSAGSNGQDQGAGSGPTFWGYLLVGVKGIFDALFTNNLPEHQSTSSLIEPLLTGVKVVIRIALVMLRGNFNLTPAMTMIALTFAFNLALGSIFLIAGFVRIIKSIPMVP